MVRQPSAPQNTPKSEELRRTTRSNSRVSTTLTLKHLEKFKRRLSPGSNMLELYKASSSKTVTEVHCSCDRLNNELFQFVDDFIESQEYQDYLEFKRSVIKKDEGVQYDAMNLVGDDITDAPSPKKKKKMDVLRALSRKALRVFFLEVQIEKYLENVKNAEILKKQEEAINTIREKIAELKCVFLCNREEKIIKRKEREQALVRRFNDRHKIDLSRIISTTRLDKVILDIEKKLRMKRKCQKKNIKIIVEKLLKEYSHNKRAVRERKKRLNSKKERIMREGVVMHIKGRRGSQYMISSMNMGRKEDAILNAFREAGVCINEKEWEVSGMANLLEKGCSTDVPYDTSHKSMQVTKDMTSPIFQEDKMLKMKLDENAKDKLGIMESFVQFEDFLEVRHFFCTCEKERMEKEMAEINYPDDSAIFSRPDRVTFKGFETGMLCSKRLILRNKSRHSVRIRFFRIYCEVPKNTIYFEIENEEIKIARPGLPVNITLKFNPPKETDVILGTMVFLTCYQATYHRLMIPIECVPSVFDVIIEPKNVDFGTIPIWKFLKNPPELSKLLKVKCSSKVAHKLIINKVRNTFELDDIYINKARSMVTVVRASRSNDCTKLRQEPLSKHFLQNIQHCNSVFQMTSFFDSNIIMQRGFNPSFKIPVRSRVRQLVTYNSKLVLEESSSSSEDDGVFKQKKTLAMLESQEIIGDILKDINNWFKFDKTFVLMNAQSREQNFKISLSKIKKPGFYYEKYRLDIYDVLPDAEKYKGMQEIAITLEVPDFFIKCDPVCVDFGICFYGTTYQASFGISNTSKNSHSLSVKIPTSLSYYVSLDENNVFVKAGETRRISIKLLPSFDFLLEKSKYFDRDTYILYFPIEVKLVEKKYADVASVIEHCYAIINDCSDLKLDPHRDHFKKVDGNMILDMGECSVSEAVTKQIVLRNSSYSKRYYGFSNLPKWITIMPEYGYGSINAFQEISLDIFIHPQVEDFKGDHFREERHFTISVETVANLGKYRKKPNMNRLLKLAKHVLVEMDNKLDIHMLESIFITKVNIREEMSLCSCRSAQRIKKSSASTLTKQESTHSKKEESDTSDTSKVEDDKVSIITTKSHKKKRRLSSKHHGADVASRKSESADTFKKRRKSSKYKYSTDSVLTPASTTDEESDHPPDFQLERQPSLLAKKSITPISRISIADPAMKEEGNRPENLSRELRLKIVFVKPLYEFSYNRIEFPVTPGGSYSIMMTDLRPLKVMGKSCVCNSGKEGKKPRYRSTFSIKGSTQEIRIEPMYGVLEHGESMKLTLVATPKMNEDVIAAYAYDGKRNALYDAKMAEELKRREEAFSRRQKKSKAKITLNTKKGKKRRSISIEAEINKSMPAVKEEKIDIEIAPEEIQVDYSDLYPAELALWRNIEPYFLNTNFVCRVDYEMDEPWSHAPDIFSLETVCKIVSPDFIHDQKTQHLNFGQVPIGDCARKILTIQNLRYQDITVKTSILKPQGGFFCPNFDSIELPSECFLKIPITYSPTQEESALEYMEVRAERTVYRFLLTAEAAIPNIRLEPSSKVVRVVSKRGKLSEVSFQIVNDSRQPVKVSLEKVCELEGRIVHHPSHRKSVRSDHMLKKIEVPKVMDSILKKRMSYSDELSEDEIYSIDNEFTSTKELSYFRLSEEDTKLQLDESSKKTVKIYFGQKMSNENYSKTIRRGQRKKSTTDINEDDYGKTYVAKYNLLIGSSFFLRDFIILAEVK